MCRPRVKTFKEPKHIQDYPVGPCYDAGHLVTTNASWRTEKPVLDKDQCVVCLYCYISCPEGVIYKSEGEIDIDYDFCKGCGVCKTECRIGAISMVEEE